MKLAWVIAAAVLLPAAARADWTNLRVGMERERVASCVGQPLLQNHGRAGAEIWTYDRCGYIEFQHGRLTFWVPSKPDPSRQPPTRAMLAQRPKSARPAPGALAVGD